MNMPVSPLVQSVTNDDSEYWRRSPRPLQTCIPKLNPRPSQNRGVSGRIRICDAWLWAGLRANPVWDSTSGTAWEQWPKRISMNLAALVEDGERGVRAVAFEHNKALRITEAKRCLTLKSFPK